MVFSPYRIPIRTNLYVAIWYENSFWASNLCAQMNKSIHHVHGLTFFIMAFICDLRPRCLLIFSAWKFQILACVLVDVFHPFQLSEFEHSKSGALKVFPFIYKICLNDLIHNKKNEKNRLFVTKRNLYKHVSAVQTHFYPMRACKWNWILSDLHVLLSIRRNNLHGFGFILRATWMML